MDLPKGYEYRHGFVHQVDREPFDYDLEYKEKQSTNVEMSYLRMGWLAASIPHEELRDFYVVDVGSGNGEFARCASKHFKKVCEYDLSGDTISREELMGTPWDLAVFSDVVEHFPDLNEFIDIPWTYAMVSFPETPEVESFEELQAWRHFKPNEHLWYMTGKGFSAWATKNIPGVKIINQGYFEDMIRARWDKNKPNISTTLLKRDVRS
jgi:hypothetical protein